MKKSLAIASVSLLVSAFALTAFAQTVNQFQSNGTTAIASGGTVTGASVVLSTALPADNDNSGQDAICPLPIRRVPTHQDNYDDWIFDGFEVKPVATAFNNAGLAAAGSVVGTTYNRSESAAGLGSGTFHWVGHYTHTVGSVITFCDGSIKDTRAALPGTTAALTFVIPAAAPPPPPPPPPGPTGTIKVNSENFIFRTIPVPSSWDFSAPIDPCLSSSCKNLPAATYAGAAVDVYTIAPIQGSAGAQYAFDKIESAPNAPELAEAPQGLFAHLITLSRGVLGSVAEAFSFPSTNPPSQSLSAAGTASFIILWDPIADIGFNPATISLSSGTPSTPVVISNSGAPGSTLTWTATVSVPWLSVSVPSGALTNGVAGNASQSITVTADPATAPATPTTVNVDFAIQSVPGAFSPVTKFVTLPVTYGGAPPPPPPPTAVCGNGVVEAPEACDQGAANGICPAACSASCTTNTCPPPPSCTFTASPSTIVVPEQTNLNYNCVNVTTCNLSGGQFGASGVPLTVAGTSAVGAKAASPSDDTTYILSCYGEEPPPGSNTNYQQNVNVKVKVQAPGRIETTP